MIVIWAGGQGNLPLSIFLFLLLNTNLVTYVLAAAPTLLAVGVAVMGATQLFPETARPFWDRVGQNLDRYMPWYQMQAPWTWDWAGEPRQNRTEHRVREAEAAVRSYPTETYVLPVDRVHMTVSDVKGILYNRGIDLKTGTVDKSDLLDHFADEATNCAICLDDFATGDKLRILGCKHLFHQPCVDKWANAACDMSRPVSCPMCNCPLREKSTG